MGMWGQFRCCLDFRHFPIFKKNYPFYPFLILKIILFSLFECGFCLKLGQHLDFKKDRKRIKTSELVEYIVDLVFVGQVCPTYKLQADLEREGVKVLSVKYCKYEFKIAKTKL